MREFTKSERQAISGLMSDRRFIMLVHWLAETLQSAHKKIYRSSTDREQHFATGRAIVLDEILEAINKAPLELGDDNKAPILKETLY